MHWLMPQLSRPVTRGQKSEQMDCFSSSYKRNHLLIHNSQHPDRITWERKSLITYTWNFVVFHNKGKWGSVRNWCLDSESLRRNFSIHLLTEKITKILINNSIWIVQGQGHLHAKYPLKFVRYKALDTKIDILTNQVVIHPLQHHKHIKYMMPTATDDPRNCQVLPQKEKKKKQNKSESKAC